MSRIERALEKAANLRDNIIEKKGVEEKIVLQPAKRHTPPPLTGNNEIKIRTEKPLLATLYDPHSPVSEEYRKLKSALSAYVQGDIFNNVIMVTSSVSGEGKSITSLNLAISLAQELDHTVLLVDADLRKPSIQDLLDIKHSKGLSDHLTDGTPINDLLIKIGVGRLTLLPAGTPLKNPVELFSSQKLKDFILEIKNRYHDRFIIIDTPPILPFAETRLLSKIVDGIVFVIREGKSTTENINESMKSFDKAKLVGAVYNDATLVNLNGYYHSYYYGYGFSKQGKEVRGQLTAYVKQLKEASNKSSFIRKLLNR